MVTFRVLKTNGHPLSNQQVIVRTLGQWDFGITSRNGEVSLPLHHDVIGRIIIGGKSVYLGQLGIGIIYVN